MDSSKSSSQDEDHILDGLVKTAQLKSRKHKGGIKAIRLSPQLSQYPGNKATVKSNTQTSARQLRTFHNRHNQKSIPDGEKTSEDINVDVLNRQNQFKLLGCSKMKTKNLNISDSLNTSLNTTLSTSTASRGLDISANQKDAFDSVGNLLDQCCDNLFKQQTKKPTSQRTSSLQRKEMLHRSTEVQDERLVNDQRLRTNIKRTPTEPGLSICDIGSSDFANDLNKDCANGEVIKGKSRCGVARNNLSKPICDNIQERTERVSICDSIDKVKNVIIDLNQRSSSRIRSKLMLTKKQSKLDQYMMKAVPEGRDSNTVNLQMNTEHGASDKVPGVESTIEHHPPDEESEAIIIVNEINNKHSQNANRGMDSSEALRVNSLQSMNSTVCDSVIQTADNESTSVMPNNDVKPIYWKNVQINELEFIYLRRRNSKANQTDSDHNSRRKRVKIDEIVVPSQSGVKMEVRTSGIYLERNIVKVKRALEKKKKNQVSEEVITVKYQKLKRKSSESACHHGTQDNKRRRNQTQTVQRPVAVCKPYFTRSESAPRAAKQKCQEKIKDLSFDIKFDLKEMFVVSKAQKEKLRENKPGDIDEKTDVDNGEERNDDLILKDSAARENDIHVETVDTVEHEKESHQNPISDEMFVSRDTGEKHCEIAEKTCEKYADIEKHFRKPKRSRSNNRTIIIVPETNTVKNIQKVIHENDRSKQLRLDKTVLNLPAFRIKINNQKEYATTETKDVKVKKVKSLKDEQAVVQNVKTTRMKNVNVSKNVNHPDIVNQSISLNCSKNMSTSEKVNIVKNGTVCEDVTHPDYEPTPGRRPTVVHSLGGLAEKEQELGKNLTLSRQSLGPLFSQLKPAKNVIVDSCVNLL